MKSEMCNFTEIASLAFASTDASVLGWNVSFAYGYDRACPFPDGTETPGV